MKMELEVTLVKASNIQAFVNSLNEWFVLCIFLFVMWGLTLALLVSKKWVVMPPLHQKIKLKKGRDWIGLLWSYSSLILVWVFYLARGYR